MFRKNKRKKKPGDSSSNTSAESDQPNAFSVLPDETILYILHFLNARDLASVDLTEKRLHNIAHDEKLALEHPDTQKQKQLYQSRQLALQLDHLFDTTKTKNRKEKKTAKEIKELQKGILYIAVIGSNPERILQLPSETPEEYLQSGKHTIGGSPYNERTRFRSTSVSLGKGADFKIHLEGGSMNSSYNNEILQGLSDYKIIIFCPDVSTDLSSQMALLSKQTASKNIKVVFVVDGDTNQNKFISIKLEQNDTFEDFFKRMMLLLAEKLRGNLTEKKGAAIKGPKEK